MDLDDIGEKILNQPKSSQLLEYEEPEPVKSTGFLSFLKGILPNARSQPLLVPSDLDRSVNNKDMDNDIDKEDKAEEEHISDKDGEEEDVEYHNEEQFVAESGDENDSSIEQEEADNQIQHSLIEDAFISIDSQAMEDSVTLDTTTRTSPKDRRTVRLDWKRGLSLAQIDEKVEEIIEELSIVREKQPWSRDSFYRGSSLAEVFEMEVQDAIQYLSPSKAEHAVRQYLLLSITNCIHSLWPKAKTFVFGSFQTRLYLPSSDLDVVVDLKAGGYGDSGSLQNHHRLSKAIQKAEIASKVEIIKARVPILKFTDSLAQINVDVSFNMDNGPQAARIVNKFSSQYPALRPLALLVKQFLHMRGLNEVFSGGLGSYGITAMVLSFLQIHPRIQSNQIKQEQNLGVLLMEFLDLFGKRFNYDRVGISLRNGGTYFIKGRLGNLGNPKPGSFTVEDPQDTDNDITRGSYNMRMVAMAFSHGLDCLTSSFFENYERQYDYSDYKIVSILGTVISLPESTIEHRKHIHTVYDDLVKQGRISGDDEELVGIDSHTGLISSIEASLLGISDETRKRVLSEHFGSDSTSDSETAATPRKKSKLTPAQKARRKANKKKKKQRV